MPELTDEQLAEIRLDHRVGYDAFMQRLSKKHGVSPDCIEAIVHGRPWRHLAEREQLPLRDLFGVKG
jgi:hypothetical protein